MFCCVLRKRERAIQNIFTVSSVNCNYKHVVLFCNITIFPPTHESLSGELILIRTGWLSIQACKRVRNNAVDTSKKHFWYKFEYSLVHAGNKIARKGSQARHGALPCRFAAHCRRYLWIYSTAELKVGRCQTIAGQHSSPCFVVKVCEHNN